MAAAWGAGLATIAADGAVLDTWYPSLGWGDAVPETVDFAGLQAAELSDEVRGVRIVAVTTLIETDVAPAGPSDGYLRLHLLSSRLTAPRTINLDGLFGVLANVAWTNLGPVAVADVAAVALRERVAGRLLTVRSIDRFPRMLDYVVPAGVRIADADRVRLGAHLAEGTVVMHEGFCNFNAGTLGTSMVEGRISQGVIVGRGSDIGGGASIQGTLSGGGTHVVSVGEGCLLGANSGLGISLGDNSVVEAGLYITAGTPVKLPDGDVVKARELSGISNALFIRNGQSGVVELRQRTGHWGGLNAALHKH